MKRLLNEKVTMIGLSMGGIAAYHLALDQPQRLTGIVAISAIADPDPLLVRWRDRIFAEVSLRVGTQLLKLDIYVFLNNRN